MMKTDRKDGAQSAVLFCVYVLLPVSRKRFPGCVILSVSEESCRRRRTQKDPSAASRLRMTRRRRASGGVSVFPYVYPPDKNAAANKDEPLSRILRKENLPAVPRKRLVAQRRRHEGVYNRIAAASGIACGEEKRARQASSGVSMLLDCTTLPTKTPPRTKTSPYHGFSARRIFLPCPASDW